MKLLLGRVGAVPARPTLPRPGWSDLVLAELDETVRLVYARLGGAHEQPRIAPGPWDVQLDGVAIELDEENHFNRYRLATLGAHAYERITQVDRSEYRLWCASEESACLTYGRYWTNDSCEREFGPPGRHGDLSGLGSPRWKQRAFYDFIKDLAPECLALSVARLSIYEDLSLGADRTSLGNVLQRPLGDDEADAWAAALAERIRIRAG